MILISVSRSKGYLSWVAYAEGHVIGRQTKRFDERDSVASAIALSEYLQEAFKAVKGYLDDPSVPYDLSDKIVVEVSSIRAYRWLTERDISDSFYHTAMDCLTLFNELSIPVKVVLAENASRLWASKYNSEEFVTSTAPEVASALDWVSSITE